MTDAHGRPEQTEDTDQRTASDAQQIEGRDQRTASDAQQTVSLNTSQAAQQLGVDSRTVRRYISEALYCGGDTRLWPDCPARSPSGSHPAWARMANLPDRLGSVQTAKGPRRHGRPGPRTAYASRGGEPSAYCLRATHRRRVRTSVAGSR